MGQITQDVDVARWRSARGIGLVAALAISSAAGLSGCTAPAGGRSAAQVWPHADAGNQGGSWEAILPTATLPRAAEVGSDGAGWEASRRDLALAGPLDVAYQPADVWPASGAPRLDDLRRASLSPRPELIIFYRTRGR